MLITKILYIIPNLRMGGAERLVVDIVRYLNSTNTFNAELIIFNDIIEYEVDDIKDKIHKIPSNIELSLYKKNKLNIAALQKFIDNYQPDIIHTHLFEAEIVSRSINYKKAKWFSHCHDNMVQFENFNIQTLLNKRKLTNFFEKKYLFKKYSKNGGNQFIAISKDTQCYFEKTAKPYNVTLLPNAINYRRFFQEKIFNNDYIKIKLINIGSFVYKKNQTFLIEVAKVLSNKKIEIELHFLGDGVNRKKLELKAREYGLDNKVYFHGNVNNVEEYLWDSDIYLHAATYEPLGLVLLEAMASGLPVITLDGKGNRDLMVQGKNGYMLFENNPEKFAEKIVDLWNDKEKYIQISKFAQEYAKQYDIKPYVEKLLNLYLESLSEKK